MSSVTLIITRNKQNSLFDAVVMSLISLFLSYGLLTNLSSSKVENSASILFLLVCGVLTGIAWYRYFTKKIILIKVAETGIMFKKNEIKWESIASYRITKYISEEVIHHIYFRLKDNEKELKFNLPEFDIPVDSLVKAINVFAEKYKFSYLGIFNRL